LPNQRYYKQEKSKPKEQFRSISPRKRPSPSSQHRDRSRRSRTPVEIVTDAQEQPASANPTHNTTDNTSLKLYESNPQFEHDIGVVDDTFLFGGELIQDPNWKNQFGELMKKLRVHSTTKRSQRKNQAEQQHNVPLKEEQKKSTKIYGKRRHSDLNYDDYDRRSDRYDRDDRERKRARSRSPSQERSDYDRRSSWNSYSHDRYSDRRYS
jgi:hypothetical protein